MNNNSQYSVKERLHIRIVTVSGFFIISPFFPFPLFTLVIHQNRHVIL